MSPIFGRRFRRALALGLGAGAVLAGAGIAAQTVATRRDQHRFPPPGDHYDLGGRRLHARVMGAGQPGPTVVFEAGLGLPLETWGWIQPAVAQQAPTLAYDRAGLGASDPASGPRTAAALTADLHHLLTLTGLPAPYVLVGHSIGGLLIRHFAATHPDLVAGLVLVDSTHPDQLRRSTRQWLGLPLVRAQLQGAVINSLLGTIRKTGRYLASPGIETLPEADRGTARARMLDPRANRHAYRELNAWLTHFIDEVNDHPGTFPGDIPLAVVTAGKVVEDDPVHHELQAELAQLSLKGTHQVVEPADHLGLVMNQEYAAVVAESVTAVVAAAR